MVVTMVEQWVEYLAEMKVFLRAGKRVELLVVYSVDWKVGQLVE